jgi:hypothetical protein
MSSNLVDLVKNYLDAEKAYLEVTGAEYSPEVYKILDRSYDAIMALHEVTGSDTASPGQLRVLCQIFWTIGVPNWEHPAKYGPREYEESARWLLHDYDPSKRPAHS